MLSGGANLIAKTHPKLDPKDSITALHFALRLYTGGDPGTGITEGGGGQEAKHITKVYEALLSGGSKSNREDPPPNSTLRIP